MKILFRWVRFNVVGMLGMGVQLTALAVFNRSMRGHSLCALAAAIELTLLHNFLWHMHYTWRDRRGDTTLVQQALRFQLSNGAVSLAGNIVLMRLLAGQAHLPLIQSNAIAILACSLVNFYVGNRWSFPQVAETAQKAALEDLPI